MSVEDNKEVVRHMYSLLNKGELEATFELFSAGYIEHSGNRKINREHLKQSVMVFFDAFTDVKITVEEMVAEGDKVAVRETWIATHTGGDFMGIAPTGKVIRMTNTCIFKITGGEIAECWATLDSLNTLQQLGLLPPTEEIGK